MPDRIAEIQKDNPELADALRLSAVSLITTPRNTVEEAHLVNILCQLEPFLRAGGIQVKRLLQSKLHGLIDNSESNSNYARSFPSLRAAAIDTLCALGSRESFDLIRSHATAQRVLKLPGKDISAGESDPTVRQTALRALKKLGDPMLRFLMNTLDEEETNQTLVSPLPDASYITT